jgi:peptidoglycan/LPS O-acetylase OafA/YrhL
VFGFNAPMERTYMASDARVDSILFGCALAVWRNPVVDDYPLDARRWGLLWLPLALLVLAVCMVARDPAFRETARYTLQGAALTVVFVAAIRFRQWPPFRVLNSRVAVFIGMLSYSLYLVHFAVLFAMERIAPTLHPVPRGTLALALSIGASYAIYRLVEKPCARLRRRLTD